MKACAVFSELSSTSLRYHNSEGAQEFSFTHNCFKYNCETLCTTQDADMTSVVLVNLGKLFSY